MDWPGADVLAKRLKKMVPPQLLEDEDQKNDPAQQLAQMQQVMQQMQQALQQAQQAAQEAAQSLQEAESNTLSTHAEIERLRTDLNTAQAELTITKQSGKLAIDQMRAQMKMKQDFDEAAEALKGMAQPNTEGAPE
jgi:chromosome segregation ATPase